MIRIHIIEDNPFYLQFLKSYFENKSGYEVEAYTNGNDYLNSSGSKPDFILLDYFLDENEGDMNGDMLYKQIRKLTPESMVIFLSGQDDGKVVLNLIKEGIRNYVIKDDDAINQIEKIINENT